MNPRIKKHLRNFIYAVIFIAMIGCFIYLGDKYTTKEAPKITITDYYKNVKNNKFKIVKGRELISLLKKGKHLIVIGNKDSDYSKKYMEEINAIVTELEIDKIYYYDLINDKAQGNSNYYEIVELLDGYLVTTDTSRKNLFAPSFYIIDNGKVKYYNVEAIAMKNTDTVQTYWDQEKEFSFNYEVTDAINKYYLNK